MGISGFRDWPETVRHHFGRQGFGGFLFAMIAKKPGTIYKIPGTIYKNPGTIYKNPGAICQPLRRTHPKGLLASPNVCPPPRSIAEDGKTSSLERTCFVKQCRDKFGLTTGQMLSYSQTQLTEAERYLMNRREMESLDIQYASLIVSQLCPTNDMYDWLTCQNMYH